MISWRAPMSFVLKTAVVSFLLILSFSLPFKPVSGKVIDQILAAVNGHLEPNAQFGPGGLELVQPRTSEKLPRRLIEDDHL